MVVGSFRNLPLQQFIDYLQILQVLKIPGSMDMKKETLVLMTLFLCQVYAAYVWLFCWPKTPASNISSPSNIKCNEARDIKMTFLILSKGE